METSDLQALVKRIPSKSHFHKYPNSLQNEILEAILKGDTPYLIVKRLKDQGKTNITVHQLYRIKRYIMPLWVEANSPNIFFFPAEMDKTLKKLEFLINEQYSRIVEALETESEEKDLLKPNKFSKINPNDEYLNLTKLIREYHENTISEVDKKVLFSIMDRKGQDHSIDKRVGEFQKLVGQYLVLRQALGDDVKLPTKEPEKKERFQVERIEGFDANEMGRQTRQKVIAATKKKK